MDQCHSTVGEQPASKPRAASHEQVGTDGRKYWRSVEDLADTPDFREWLEREMPAGASRLLESSRRSFLKLMGASVALAGAATIPGCRRPDHKILPYSREVPEDVIPGKPLFFATSLPLPGGDVEGVLVETHENRPTKIEGNPLHPVNRGKSGLWAQSSILGLYDPDRLKDPVLASLPGDEGSKSRSWDDVAAWFGPHFDRLATKQGQGLWFVVEKRQSPTRDAVRAMVEKRFPRARWVSYDPLHSDAQARALGAVIGKPCRELFKLESADVVVSFDRDLLGLEPGSLVNARGFASRRTVETGAMSRLYVIESSLSITGGRADHRLAMAPSMIPSMVIALAKELASQGLSLPEPVRAALGRTGTPTGVTIDSTFVRELAKDLLKDDQGRARTGRTLVCAGPAQPAGVHALCVAINAALGNIGRTVSYREVTADFASNGAEGLSALTAELEAGRVDTVICIGVNPVYDAPGTIDFASRFAKATHRIVASVDDNETVAASTWRLPMSHWLETWGDAVAIDGTASPIQPMIAPLFGTRSDIEILAMIAGVANPDGYEFLRNVWRERLAGASAGGFEATWKRSLFNGVFAEGTAMAVDATVGARAADQIARLAEAGAPATGENFDVVFAVGNVGDGRFANAAWLHELPEPTTRIAWDNVAMVSVATAVKYGLEQDKATTEHRMARMIELSVGGQSVRLPAWVTPGVPDNTVVVQVGYGRTVCGHVGTGVGFNVYGILPRDGSRSARGASIRRATSGPLSHQIVTTQAHGSMEGRAIVREVDLPAVKKWGSFESNRALLAALPSEKRDRIKYDSYKQERDLNFAEMLGELSHTPANVNAYINPQRGTKTMENAPRGTHPSAATGRPPQPNTLPDFAKRPQWGMTIDLTTCTGCNVCTVACQAENNIPVVGKAEVNKGREMHWIRVDRYFAGPNVANPDSVLFQPVACVQCENAPCETVCPVNATVHGPEGINYMVYNRCIGTRYCANNCPYKVRRFNFFEYGTRKLNGGFIGQETLRGAGIDGPSNVNLIPPRLREQINNIQKLKMNPDVTVRSRGVMEKCTYCIQRINEARIEIKLKNLDYIPDGFVQAACQQACPSGAIVFGDIEDPESTVAKLRNGQRSYSLLGYLNTRPRTTYLLSVRNPNPALITDKHRRHAWDEPFHHGHGPDADHGGHARSGGAMPPEHASASVMGVDTLKRIEDQGYRLSLAVLAGV